MSNVSITTFNCGKLFPFDNNDAINSVLDAIIPKQSENFDLIVLGLQEFSLIWECLTPDIVTRQINQVSDQILTYLGSGYNLVAAANTGGTVIFIYTKNTVTVQTLVRNNCHRGVLGSSLKGGVSLTLQISNSMLSDSIETFTFICCHLAANEGPQNVQYRIDDVKSILESCNDQIPSFLLKNSLLFFFGDLNFRVNPSIINNNGDELLNLLETNEAFKKFNEPKIHFDKTYKYVLYDENNVFNEKRVPSWCDRILYRSMNKNDDIDIISYDSLPRVTALLFTDHQPVRLNFTTKGVSRSSSDSVVWKRSDDNTHEFHYGDVLIGYADWCRYRRMHYWTIPIVILVYFIQALFFK
ncbi:phosphatidylinositol 4,5-bisphosphate 5-phosphatase Inp54p [Monosporozyma servazzii]